MQGKWSIREAKLEDAAELLAIYAPYVEKTAITFEYTVPSVAEFAERMQQVQQRYPYLVAEQDGKLLGYVYAGPFHERAAYDWAVETSLYVRQGVRRTGIGTALYAALETCLQEQGILNLNACIAYPEEEKDPYLSLDSVRFHEKWAIRWWDCFILAAISFSVGIIWFGWRKQLAHIWQSSRLFNHFQQFKSRHCKKFQKTLDKWEKIGYTNGCKRE